MNDFSSEKDVWLIYDGECPLCRNAAYFIQIKKNYSSFHLLNARNLKSDHALLDKINRLGLDLDEGMVVYVNQRFYHGKNALTFLAKNGTTENIFTDLLMNLFRSNIINYFLYPLLRSTRNFLLRRGKVKQINNLNIKK